MQNSGPDLADRGGRSSYGTTVACRSSARQSAAADWSHPKVRGFQAPCVHSCGAGEAPGKRLPAYALVASRCTQHGTGCPIHRNRFAHSPGCLIKRYSPTIRPSQDHELIKSSTGPAGRQAWLIPCRGPCGCACRAHRYSTACGQYRGRGHAGRCGGGMLAIGSVPRSQATGRATRASPAGRG